MSTLFDTIIRSENDHTNLLRGVMERHPNLAAKVMTSLIRREVSQVEAGYLTTETQHLFEHPDGRSIPDILVRGTGGLHCLVEAKIDPNLPLTDRQLLGYRSCFPDFGERYLCFLLPQEWRHSRTIIEVEANLTGSGIRVVSTKWQEVLRVIGQVSSEINDAVVSEALTFWRWRFEVIAMTEEDRTSLSKWPNCRYSALRRLEKTLDQAKRLFDAQGTQTELETSDANYYGFYVKRGKSYVVWVGIWDGFHKPLSYGYRLTNGAWISPAAPLSEASQFKDHHLVTMDAACWDSPELLYKTVSKAIDDHWPV